MVFIVATVQLTTTFLEKIDAVVPNRPTGSPFCPSFQTLPFPDFLFSKDRTSWATANGLTKIILLIVNIRDQTNKQLTVEQLWFTNYVPKFFSGYFARISSCTQGTQSSPGDSQNTVQAIMSSKRQIVILEKKKKDTTPAIKYNWKKWI